MINHYEPIGVLPTFFEWCISIFTCCVNRWAFSSCMFFAGRPLKRAVALCKATRKAGITWTLNNCMTAKGFGLQKDTKHGKVCLIIYVFQTLLFRGSVGFRGCRGFVGMYISAWMLIWPKIWWRWWRGFKTGNWWWLMVQGCWCESRLLKSSAIERLSRWCHLLLL